VTVEPSQASEAGKSQRKMRKRSKGRKTSGDKMSSDIASEQCSTVDNLAKQVSSSRMKQSQTSDPTQPLSAGSEESYQTQPSDDIEHAVFFEVKRYPAYHYDMYGTMYSLTDGVRPPTLEKNTIKSASADCLDVLSVTTQLSERPASNDVVHSSEQPKPKPPVKPLKPLPRAKPRAEHSKSIAKQPAVKSASADPAFVVELSSVLNQRN